jgi:(S)-citramalyl-CoA lyase
MTDLRSLLNTPAHNERALRHAMTLSPDLVVLDLEDSVPIHSKEVARQNAVATLSSPEPGPRRGVRVNPLSSSEGLRDILALIDGAAQFDYVVLPKVETPTHVELAAQLFSGRHEPRLLAVVETPMGVQNVDAIARASPRLTGRHDSPG